MKITLPSFQMAAATLEEFCANRLHMYPDGPHDPRINHKNTLELIISLLDCRDREKSVMDRCYRLGKPCTSRLLTPSHKAYSDRQDDETCFKLGA